ncbi:unnamed protein product [Schistosoma rodhaini]|nr:unnamed protein product [Schistosoma rodhaini]
MDDYKITITIDTANCVIFSITTDSSISTYITAASTSVTKNNNIIHHPACHSISTSTTTYTSTNTTNHTVNYSYKNASKTAMNTHIIRDHTSSDTNNTHIILHINTTNNFTTNTPTTIILTM